MESSGLRGVARARLTVLAAKLREHLIRRPDGVKRPSVIGKYTNDIVNDRLAPGVLAELKGNNPPIAPGRRRHKHF